MNKPNKVVWHHSNGTLRDPEASTQHHSVDVIDAHHKTLWPGFQSKVYKNPQTGEYYHCGYHFVIDVRRKEITQTRALYEEGAHCIGKNKSSVGVLIIGNYDEGIDLMPASANQLIYKVWQKIHQVFPEIIVADNVPHRRYATKSCFGNSLEDDFVQTVIFNQMPVFDQHVDKITEYDRAIFVKIIERMTEVVALLTQRVSGKRLSLKEKRNV